ncbi:MAG: hypothetical protein ACOYM0_05740 [Bacteroidales bacterium]
MKTILTEPKDIRNAVNQFKDQIIKSATSQNKSKKNFHVGTSVLGIEYAIICHTDNLHVMIPDKERDERALLLFTLNPSTTNLSSDVEITLPLALNRSISGCFVKDGKNLLVCNRGRFTSFKSVIPSKITLDYFKDSIIAVNDFDRQSEVICIANLCSPNLFEEIIAFVKKVKHLKFKVKLDSQNKAKPY